MISPSPSQAARVEAATALVMRLCRAFDLAASDESEAAHARVLTPAIKYWVCKTAPALIYESMECLGGNGYVEDSILPRLYREAPVNAIWEGSGNVMCLDVLRAIGREPEAARTVLHHLVHGGNTREMAESITATLLSADAESHARDAVERLALLAAASALAQCAPQDSTDLFVRTRLQMRRGSMFGSSAIDDKNAADILSRAVPS